MRWMWIDRIVEFVPGKRLRAVKHVSLAEEYLHDHFPADPSTALPSLPVMPGSLILEGMAQSAGLLVGYASAFREKVVLAKVSRAELHRDVGPGSIIMYCAEIERLDSTGASTRGDVSLISLDWSGHSFGAPASERQTECPIAGAAEVIGRIDLMFSHLDRNMSGQEFPEHNFVFGAAFRTLLSASGIALPHDDPDASCRAGTPG